HAIDENEQAGRALSHSGREREMREQMADAVADLFSRFDLAKAHHPVPTDEDRARLIALATFAVRARSAVERDGHTREVELVPDAESPARLVLVLHRILVGAAALG